MGGTVFFIGFWPDYERFTFTVPPPPGGDWRTVDLRETLEPRGPFRRLRRRHRLRRYGRALQREFIERPDAVYFFQDHGGLLEELERVSTPFFGGVLVRNPAGSDVRRCERLRGLQARGVRVWSFDADDCARYGFEPYAQFLRKVDDDGAAPAVDVFFLGRDKGRAPLLDAIRRNAADAGCSTDIRILSAQDRPLPYADYLGLMRRARCVIDINQAGQAGWTLRPIEAGFYGKKLITNNPDVAAAPFYRPQNIMIIDRAPSPERIAAFMRLPAEPLPAAALAPYEASTVLRRLADDARRRASLEARA
ncbi:MAG: hypothetical protein QM661_12285 [Solimonas sp.]